MHAYVMITALAVLAMFVIAHAESARDRTIGAFDCTVNCSGHVAQTDNGLGLGLPVDPYDNDDDDN